MATPTSKSAKGCRVLVSSTVFNLKKNNNRAFLLRTKERTAIGRQTAGFVRVALLYCEKEGQGHGLRKNSCTQIS